VVKVSVIVPVYNQEKYIKRCVDSILHQTLSNIEIILVDDGSTDSSLEIMHQYEKQDERVRVLTQHNMYAGVARNNGLSVAAGEYVIFWDSDDYFAENALEALYTEAKKSDADICVGEAVKEDVVTGVVNKDIHYVHKKRIPEKIPFCVNDIPQYIFNISNNYPWNKLYRLAFIRNNNLQFQNIKRSNDVYFVMTAFVKAEKITVVDDVIVYYQYRNTDSLSNNAVNNRQFVVEAFKKVRDKLEEDGLWGNDKIRQSYINKAFSTIASQLSMVDDYEEFVELYHFYKDEVLPVIGIDSDFKAEIYVPKNEYELKNMLKLDDNEYIFSLYRYYMGTSVNNRNDYLQNKEVLKETRAKLNASKEELRAKKDRIHELKDKLEAQSSRINELKKKNEEQKNLLNSKLVRLVLKIERIFHMI
jgi:glycosyltransferase involved in cell wall biosynthesis